MRDDSPHKSFWKKYGMTAISVLLIGALLICYFAIPTFKEGVHNAWDAISSNDQDRIRAWVKHFGIFGPIVLILAMTVQIFLLFIPNLLLFAIAIMCYGPVWGSVISLLGVTASSSLGFYIGNKLGPKAIDRFISQDAQDKISFFVQRYGAKAIFVFRLSSLSSDALGFVAGILEMKYKKFILATLAGITPVLILLSLYGRNGNMDKALIWLGAFAITALLLYVLIDKKKRKEELGKIGAQN